MNQWMNSEQPRTVEVLRRQYQPAQWNMPVVPQRGLMSPGTFFATLAVIGSAVVMSGRSTKMQTTIATQVLTVAAGSLLTKLFDLQ
jgi:hypothetical protein